MIQKNKTVVVPDKIILMKILIIRDIRVMIDGDLAELYTE